MVKFKAWLTVTFNHFLDIKFIMILNYDACLFHQRTKSKARSLLGNKWWELWTTLKATLTQCSAIYFYNLCHIEPDFTPHRCNIHICDWQWKWWLQSCPPHQPLNYGSSSIPLVTCCSSWISIQQLSCQSCY